MAKSAFNPDGLPVPRGSYSLVNIAQPGRMVFIAGQTASDHEGKGGERERGREERRGEGSNLLLTVKRSTSLKVWQS